MNFIKIQTVKTATKLRETFLITAQNLQRPYKQHKKYKRRPKWTNLKKIEKDYNCGFWQLVDLTVFQSSVLLFATFDIMETYLFDSEL